MYDLKYCDQQFIANFVSNEDRKKSFKARGA
jgi:hypothetical protein